MKKEYEKYGIGIGKNAYEVGTNKGRFFVIAANRAQAAKIVESDGLIVRDINRVG